MWNVELTPIYRGWGHVSDDSAKFPSVGTFSALKAQLDPINRKRKGDQFELVCKWFLENEPSQYRQLLRKVWLWRDWPGNWGIDAGIDLVAEDAEGRLWANQAKAYENNVTRGGLPSGAFLRPSRSPGSSPT